jgi:hypothetical protein
VADELKGYQKAGRGIRALGYLALLGAFGIAAAVTIPAITSGRGAGGIGVGAGLLVVVGGFAWFQIHVGRSLLQHKDWSRTAGVLLGILHLPAFPLGTLVGAYVVWNLRNWDEPQVPT